MSLSIRVATRADESEIQRVIRAVYDEYNFTWDENDYHADLYDLDQWYFDAGHAFWVAEWEGEVVATVAYMHHAAIEGPAEFTTIEGMVRLVGTDCSLERLYVHPDARRRGIGRALSEWTVQHARAQGRQAMEIWSDKRFGDAHRLYGHLGAKVVADRICDDPDVSPEWGLILPLT